MLAGLVAASVGDDLPVKDMVPSRRWWYFKTNVPVTVGHTWVEDPSSIAFDQFDRVSLQAEK